MFFWRELTLRKLIPVLFLPAGVGLFFKIATAPTAAQEVLAIALIIFCPELIRMAWVDLKNIEILNSTAVLPAASRSTQTATSFEKISLESELDKSLAQPTQQLQRFRIVVISTIVLEATGYYLTLISLPAGALVIIFSQLWFNSLVAVQLYPSQPVPVVPFKLKDRRAILVVNVITTGLLCLWPIAAIRLSLASTLLALVALYLTVKYGFRTVE